MRTGGEITRDRRNASGMTLELRWQMIMMNIVDIQNYAQLSNS